MGAVTQDAEGAVEAWSGADVEAVAAVKEADAEDGVVDTPIKDVCEFATVSAVTVVVP